MALHDDSKPEIDYLSKDFAGLRGVMLDHLRRLVPAWNETHPADMSMALVDVLAYAADYLSYYQDAVATEAYLGTARLRRSVQRHARLLDYVIHEGCNARVWVHIEVDRPEVYVRRGTQLFSQLERGGAAGVIAPRSAAYDNALAQNPVVFETKHNALLRADHNNFRFFPTGTRESTLEAGATAAVLHSAGRLQHVRVGDVLVFAEVINPQTGLPAGADPAHRHAVRLTRVVPSFERTRDGGRVEVVLVAWDAKDALPFELVTVATFGARKHVDVSLALGNIVLADHGQTIFDEELPPVPAAGRYYPSLRRRNLCYAVPYDHLQAASLPAGATITQLPYQAMPAIQSLRELSQTPVTLAAAKGPALIDTFTEDGRQGFTAKEWFVSRELLSSAGLRRDYTVEMEDDGRAFLRFGFGKVGWQPVVVGARFQTTYRVGKGNTGNVSANTIAHIVSDVAGVRRVTNFLPAQGGTDPKPTERARLHAPAVFKTRVRCVTAADYAEMATRHPGVAQAVAQMRWSGSWRTVFIFVQRHADRPLDADFRRELAAFLEPARLTGYDIEIQPPRYAGLDVKLVVTIHPDHWRSSVRDALWNALGPRRLPDGRTGFFYADNFTFGQPVYRSRLIAAAMAVPGVMRVTVDHFGRFDGATHVDPIPIGPLEIARLANDPGVPANGILVIDLKDDL